MVKKLLKVEKTKPATVAEITQEQIDAWKKEHTKGVHKLTVEDKAGFVRNPNRNDLKYAMTRLKGGGELDMAEALLEEIWLGGDSELLEDDDYFFAAVSQVQDLMQVKNASLVKL